MGGLRKSFRAGNTGRMNTQHRPRLLIPRPFEQGQAFARSVEDRMPGRWKCLMHPVMEIQFFDVPVPQGEAIFTSANGVAAWVRATDRRGIAHCVGPRTTAEAATAGFVARQAGATAAELINTLAALPSNGFVHLRGAHARGNVAHRLGIAGHQVTDLVGYAQQPVALPEWVSQDLTAGGIAAVTLFSPRSARLLHRALGGGRLDPQCTLFCLSHAVASAAALFRAERVHIAVRPDGGAILDLLAQTAAI